jgi:tRNA A-37 threonylcarbamoyl transferase component Bud32/tetratricopeptide (TPR) repeat protein
MSDAPEAAPRAAASKSSSRADRPASTRYLIEGEIARGGMGIVFRARDRVTGRVLALKRPLGDGSPSLPRHAELLEKEFRTLIALKHPRVIEVFDYGFDAAGPFYTMELLDGDDLKAQSPLPWQKVCAILHDIASCLALLHARGLVHRDVSPSNIRLTSDGRAKLLDFGALVPFGRHDVVAGTPACVCPEALDSLDIDQRVDLYALGATAYHALTGTPAFAARALTQLRALWSQGQPPPPSRQVQGIPAALDELVLSLLSLDPLSRPASAAELIDRLRVIAELPGDADADVLQSYLLNPPLVGRDEARHRVNARLKRTLSGRGGVLMIEGSVGHGKSALLHELMREGRLIGLCVLSVNARPQQTPLGTYRALLEQAAVELGERVHDVVPAELYAEGSSAADALLPGDDRVERLARGLVALSTLAPLVVAVDDADHADVDSAAVLTRASDLLAPRPLLLVLAAEADRAHEQVALRVLRRAAVRVRVTPLVSAEVERLLRTIFGEVPGIKRLAAWLIEQTSGSPMLCMELLSELVERRALRYEDGAWLLPQELPAEAARTTQAVLERRLARLGEDARSLATCMSAQRTSLGVEVCRSLAVRELSLGKEDTSAALDELLSQRVIVGDGRSYAFTQTHLRNVLYEELDPERKRRVHRLIADRLAREPGDDPCRWLSIGCHYSFSGDETEAARHLRPAIGTLTRRGDSLVRAVPDLIALWAHYQRIGLPEADQLRATMPLVIAGLYVKPTIQDRVGKRVLDLLEVRAGLGLARRLSVVLGATLSLVVGVVWGYLRYLFTPVTYRFHTYSYPLAYFGACAAMDGTASLRLDREVHVALWKRLNWLKSLPTWHPARTVYEIVCLGPLYASGRFDESAPRLSRALDNLPRLVGVDDHSRAQFANAMRFWTARIGLLRHGSEPLEHAERMAGSSGPHDRILAEFLRFAFHLGRGETALAEPFREKLDALVARYGSSWVVDLLAAGELVPYHLAGDVVGLKRCVQQLESLVVKHPSYALPLEVGRAMYEGHRGRPERALAIYDGLDEGIAPFTDPLWSHAQAHACECLNALGRHEEALARASAALEAVSATGRQEYVVAYQQLEREVAVALSGLGQFARAAMQLDALLERDGDRDQPLLVGLLHRDRARVAVADRDRDAFFLHADEARVRFRTAQNPALVAQVRKLGELAQAAGLEAERPELRDLSEDMDLVLPPASVRSDRVTRGQRVLDHVVALVGAARARLYLFRDGRAQLSAQHGEDRWEPHLGSDVDELLRSLAHEHERTAERTGQLLARSDISEAAHTLLPLIMIHDGETLVVGAVAVAEAPRLSELSFERLERLASALHEQERHVETGQHG